MSDLLALMRAFARTVELGSFTAAAQALGASQPSVSRQISQLEDHLGCLLVQRTTRALTLTEDGRTFYEHARQTLASIEEAESAVGRRRSRPSGVLRLDCAAVFGRLHVIPRLVRFQELYPDIDVRLSLSDRRSDLIEEEIELALRLGPVADPTLVARRIGWTRRSVVGRADYFAARGTPAHPSELSRHACIVYDGLSTGANWTFRTPEGPLSVAVSGPFRVDTTEGVRAGVVNGLGIGYVPTWHFEPEDLVSGELLPVLADFMPPPEPITALYPTRRHLAPRVRAAIDFFAAEFAREPQFATA